MNKLLKDRVNLIQCLYKAVSKMNGEAKGFLQVIKKIRRDEQGHFLSYSQEYPDKISYAGKSEYRLDNTRRSRTTLGRYIRRQLEITEDEISSKTLHEVTREHLLIWLEITRE